ncbi:hypothetical protein HAX54_033790 [Datura stramonium]|uniref:Uncharacterized protein n=1 Tax=Datura stramonium TaxID=4076 RepID=A0ABS8VGG3_DATST|nr:hypothetical protein [Datura stramonium]
MFYPYLYETESGPYIVIVTSTTVKEYREKLLDTSASKLVNRLLPVDNDVPSQIQRLCSKEFIFKLKLNSYNLKEELENFTVTKLFIADEKLELQSKTTKDKKVKVKPKWRISMKPKSKNKSFTNAKEHACAPLENSEDPQQDSGGSKCYKRQSLTKKKRLVKINQKIAPATRDNAEEDSHDSDDFKG